MRDSTGRERTNRPLARTHVAHRLAPALPGYRWRWAAGGSLRLSPSAPSAGLKAQSHPPSAAPVPPRLPMPTSPRADDTPSRTHAAHRLAPALPGYRWRWAAGGSLRLSPSEPSAGLKAQSHPPCATPVPPRPTARFSRQTALPRAPMLHTGAHLDQPPPWGWRGDSPPLSASTCPSSRLNASKPSPHSSSSAAAAHEANGESPSTILSAPPPAPPRIKVMGGPRLLDSSRMPHATQQLARRCP